jgi:hypothetical protein
VVCLHQCEEIALLVWRSINAARCPTFLVSHGNNYKTEKPRWYASANHLEKNNFQKYLTRTIRYH